MLPLPLPLRENHKPSLVLHTPRRSYKGLTLKQYLTRCEKEVYYTPSSERSQLEAVSSEKQGKPVVCVRKHLRDGLVASLGVGKESRSEQKLKQQLSQPKVSIQGIGTFRVQGMKELKNFSQRLANRTCLSIQNKSALSMRNIQLSLPHPNRNLMLDNTSVALPSVRERPYYLVGQQRKKILEKLRLKEQSLRAIRSTLSLFVSRCKGGGRKGSQGVRGQC